LKIKLETQNSKTEKKKELNKKKIEGKAYQIAAQQPALATYRFGM
jgi:hypothetical protein